MFYGWDAEAISFINSRYGFKNGSATKIVTFCKMIERHERKSSDDFMHAWLIVVVSSFMCPAMSLHVSPGCYPIVAELEKVKRKKKAVNCCVHHMVILWWSTFKYQIVQSGQKHGTTSV